MQRKRTEEKNVTRIGELEESNKRLQETVVDLKARSMRDNLLFHNIEESDEENCTEVIYSLLEEKHPRSQCLTSAHPLLRRDPCMVWSRES